jgi:hypothetical protein
MPTGLERAHRACEEIALGAPDIDSAGDAAAAVGRQMRVEVAT